MRKSGTIRNAGDLAEYLGVPRYKLECYNVIGEYNYDISGNVLEISIGIEESLEIISRKLKFPFTPEEYEKEIENLEDDIDAWWCAL